MTNPEVGGSGDLLKEPKDEGKVELSDEDLEGVDGGGGDFVGHPQSSPCGNFLNQGDLLPNRPVFHPDEKG